MMEENKIIAEDNDVLYAEIEESNVDITYEETIEVVEAEQIASVTVDSYEAFPALGESNENLKHSLMTGRDLHDQHPITAITGLRNELDSIEALKTVYSNKMQTANYYLWEDAISEHEDRIGYFVSVCQDVKKIKLCSGEDIFGVTVDDAAFVGGQDDIVRDYKYGLVAHTGIVNVRCELDVEVGDYVISNSYGMAKTTESGYGYKVISIEDIGDVPYATISLDISANQVDNIGKKIIVLDDRLTANEQNTTSAMNAANAALSQLENLQVSVGQQGQAASDAIKKAEEALSLSQSSQQQIAESAIISEQAKQIAADAVTSAESIRQEAVEVANDSLSNVNALIKDLEPISTWGANGEYVVVDTWDDANKDTSKVYYASDTKLYYYYLDGKWLSSSALNFGASYVTTYLKNDVATKAEIETAENGIEMNKSAIEKSATEFSTFVSSVDKYSIGEYSQAYGLTYEQAKNILKKGMIYIPFNNPNGATHSEEYDGQDQVNEFTQGHHYEWDGLDWQEKIMGITVSFLEDAVPNANQSLKYWYINSNNPPEGYEAYTLYAWDNEVKEWVKVSALVNNVNNRIQSMIRQTANEISLEVTNARGSAATLGARIKDNETTVSSLAFHVIGEYTTLETWNSSGKDTSKIYYAKDTKLYHFYKNNKWDSSIESHKAGLTGTMATVEQKADANGASIAQVVQNVGKDGTVTASSIVQAINDGKSTVRISADCINLDGYATFTSLQTSGTTKIHGGNIDTNTLTVKAANITGELLVGTIPSSIARTANIPTKLSQLSNDSQYQTASGVTSIVRGQITTDYINALGISVDAAKVSGRLNVNNVTLGGALSAYNGNTIGGYLGYLSGTTYTYSNGVATSQTTSGIGVKHDSTHYFIATNAGARMQSNESNMYVDDYGANIFVAKNSKGLTNGFGVEVQGGAELELGLKDGNGNPEFKVRAVNTLAFGKNLFASATSGSRSNLGRSTDVWNDVWASNNVIQTSDRRKKSGILYDMSNYEKLFLKLKPTQYKLIDGTSDRYHIGFISQDIESAMNEIGMDSKDFAGFIKSPVYESTLDDVEPDTNSAIVDYDYSLRYGEFIAINTHMIQKLMNRVDELEKKLS